MSDQIAARSAILDPDWASALLQARWAGVPPAMVESAREQRLNGNWRAACAAAAVDVRLDLNDVRSRYGPDVQRQILYDVSCFAPDRLRWHLPRSLPGGGPQKDLVVSLAEYPAADGATLVVRTPGVHWVAGERLVLELLDRPPVGRPAAQWRLVHHRQLWDAYCSAEHQDTADKIVAAQDAGEFAEAWRLAGFTLVTDGSAHQAKVLRRLPVDLGRLADEIRRLHGESARVTIRPGGGLAIVIAPLATYASGVDAYVTSAFAVAGLPVLPDPAWRRPIELDLLRLGLAALADLYPYQVEPDDNAVRCQGTIHRLRREGGHWIAPDHERHQSAAEQFLAALGGPPAGCHGAIAERERAETAEKARFAAHPRYLSALEGTVLWPLPPGVSMSGPGPYRPPASHRILPARQAARSRRNAKPLSGAHVPPRPDRTGAWSTANDNQW